MNSQVSVGESTYHPAPHKPRVIIVEDDATLLHMYTEKFVIENFEVIPAHDGEAAYGLIKSQTPDCVLLDLHIPKIDGLTLIEKLRSENATLPPILALTNIAEASHRKKAFELGVKEYLVKAMLTPEAVVAKVKQYITQ